MTKEGFTLIEIAVTCAVVSVLALLAAPYYLQFRAGAVKGSCINNLRILDAAKSQYAIENGKDTQTVPDAADLLPYLKGADFPSCPASGMYTIASVGSKPTCSQPGHSLDG